MNNHYWGDFPSKEIPKFQTRAKNMLAKTSPIVMSYLNEDGAYFNLLNTLNKENDEVHTHSKIIFELLLKTYISDGSADFLKLLLSELSIPPKYINQTWTPYRERCFDNGRIDFVLECKDFCIAIEMKIYAGDQPLQLERYEDFCKSRHKNYMVCYLTLEGRKPSEKSMGKMDRNRLKLISFKREIYSWLQKCMGEVKSGGYQYSFIKQYCAAVEHLTTEESDFELMKNIISTTEDARTVTFLCSGLMAKMTDILADFFDGLRHRLENETGLVTDVDIDDVKNNTWFLEQKQHGTITKIKSITLGRVTYSLSVYTAIESVLYAGIGFYKDTKNEKCWSPFSEVQKKAPAFYNEWIQKIENLHLKGVGVSDMTYYFNLENTQGKSIDFTYCSFESLDLIDNFDIQLEYISDFLINQIIRKFMD